MGGFTCPLVQNFVLLGELQEVLLDKLLGVTGRLGMETLLFIYLCIIYVLFMYCCNTITTSQIPDHYLH